MAVPNWLKLVATLGLTALEAFPQTAPIAGPIAIGIQEAEQIAGASGQEKLQHAVNIAVQAATAAQAKGVNVDPTAVAATAGTAISTAVQVVNLVHAAKA